MKTNKWILPAALAIVGAVAMAQAAHAENPTLDAHEQGIDDPARHSKALRLGSLAMDVDVVGAIAEFAVTARFDNPSEEILEGEFTFQLPDGAVVTGYALDVEGRMIDGVLVEPLKAQRAYEEKVRQGIDPGVAKVTRANVFSTRVYPILERGSRTIRLRFAAPIHPDRGLRFPLETAKPVGRVALKARGRAPDETLALTIPGIPLRPDGTAAAQNIALRGEVRIDAPRGDARSFLTRHTSGQDFFQIVDAAVANATASANAPAASGQRLRIYWDRSLSRRGHRLAEERALLARYVAQAKPASIDLVVFNSSGARTQRVAADGIDGALKNVLYRGATSFAVLERIDVPAADVCLVFSDGVVTIDARRDFRPGCQVFAITSARDADGGFLRRIAGTTDAVVRIGTGTEAELLARLRGAGPKVIEARGADGRALSFAAVNGGAGWAVVGEAPADGVVILRIAGLGAELVERRYALKPARTTAFGGTAALWARDRIALLSAHDDGHAELVKLSRRFSVASPHLSFVVLEDADDYVQAGIEPPASYPKESMARYRQAKAAHDATMREQKASRLEHVADAWEEQKRWWNTKFELKPRKIATPDKRINGPVPTQAMPEPAQSPEIGSFPDAAGPEALQRVSGNDMEELSEVSVTGFRASESGISVQLEAWNSERPYIKALDAAAPEAIDRVLAREETRHGALPAFYFDVAEWLFRRKRVIEAVEMLLSALDLPVANEETAAMVADRLQRYGRIDRAVWLYERLARESDDLPQPRRALALALARRADGATAAMARADLKRAAALLDEVVMTPWDERYDGIELIALMEANLLLPKLRKAGVTEVPLDPKLRALLDVDLRVTLEWNTGATDMDLWVDEPTGERVLYSQPKSQIGGRLSNDMTAGFGPEEYLLHHAVPGEYAVSVNVYSADAINPNGTTVITVRLIRDFGRETQKEETMEVELEPEESGQKLIGKFTVR
jgi:hypothetical protein